MSGSKALTKKPSIWADAQDVADTLREPFLVLDNKLRVLLANKSFYVLFQTRREDTEGKKIDHLGDGQWSIPKLRGSLDDILSKDAYVEDLELEYSFPKIGTKVFLINARAIRRENELTPVILLAMEDAHKSAERTAELEERVKELERLNKAMVGRELKMMELKKEIEILREKIKGQ